MLDEGDDGEYLPEQMQDGMYVTRIKSSNFIKNRYFLLLQRKAYFILFIQRHLKRQWGPSPLHLPELRAIYVNHLKEMKLRV